MNSVRNGIFFIITFVILVLPRYVFAAPAVPGSADNGESIREMADEIVIDPSGSIQISETIVYDFAVENRHGIFRTIPLIKVNEKGETYALDIGHIQVKDDMGRSYQYTESKDDRILTIKIGDPDTTITGIHTYILSYTVAGAITYFSDHDELYWNLTGNEWNVPIRSVRARITLPQTEMKGDGKAACFTGIKGSKESECAATVNDGVFSYESKRKLSSGEGMTGVAGFARGIVAVTLPKRVISFSETTEGKTVSLIISFCITILVLWWYIIYPIWIAVKWFRHGRDPKPVSGAVTAWFSPPKVKSGQDMLPGAVGALLEQSADRNDITATIVDLARRGYLTMKEKKKNDWWFIRNKKHADEKQLMPYEQKLFDDFFTDGDELSLSDAHLYTTVEEVKKKINVQLVSDGLYYSNPAATRLFYSMIGVAGLMTFNLPLLFSAFLFGRAMPKRTLFGAEADAVGKSLKNFLVTQNKKLAFQADRQMMFEKLLPYAIAFGVEKIWAKRFENRSLTQPVWYQPYGSNQFNSILLVNSLSSSASSFYRAATSPSSSSGFSSGFSGGSSGGGGGGGGGGSW